MQNTSSDVADLFSIVTIFFEVCMKKMLPGGIRLCEHSKEFVKLKLLRRLRTNVRRCVAGLGIEKCIFVCIIKS